jgi:hypothetical protein
MASRVTASLLYATTCLTSLSGIADPAQVDAFAIDEQALYRRHHRSEQHPATATNHDRPMHTQHAFQMEDVDNDDADEDVSATKIPLPAGVVDFRTIARAPFGRLTVSSRQHYIDMAIFLAHDHLSRLRWRRCLETSRWYSPLFDSSAFARSLENAYSRMWSTWQTSQSIRDVMVAPVLSKALVITGANSDPEVTAASIAYLAVPLLSHFFRIRFSHEFVVHLRVPTQNNVSSFSDRRRHAYMSRIAHYRALAKCAIEFTLRSFHSLPPFLPSSTPHRPSRPRPTPSCQ